MAPEPDVTLRPGASLSWDQTVTSRVPISALSFTLYVDGEPVALPAVRCNAGPAGVYVCSTPVPPLSPGLYALTVSASDGREESLRSVTLLAKVEAAAPTTMAAVATAAPMPPGAGWTGTAPLVDPADMLVVSDDLTLLAERPGRVRVFRAGQVAAEPALTLDDVHSGQGHGLLALAAGPDVARTGTVYLLYSAGTGLRLARAQLAHGRLSRPVVILDGLPAAARMPQAAMRVGPDGSIYVALGDSGDRDRAYDLGDWAGKLLRVTPDGTTPRDQPAASPVVLAGLSAPTALTWSAATGTLWLADRTHDGGVVLHQVPSTTAGGAAAVTPLAVATPVARVSMAAGPRAGELFVAIVGRDGAGLGVRRLEIASNGELRSEREEAMPESQPILTLVALDAGVLAYQTPVAAGRVRVR